MRLILHRGFESLLLRHTNKKALVARLGLFYLAIVHQARTPHKLPLLGSTHKGGWHSLNPVNHTVPPTTGFNHERNVFTSARSGLSANSSSNLIHTGNLIPAFLRGRVLSNTSLINPCLATYSACSTGQSANSA